MWGRVSRHQAVIEVLWRYQSRLGLVVFNASRAVRTARSAAIAYAGLAETFLRAQVPTTAYDTVLSQVRPDGTVSKPTALQAFALSYGSLPGVHVPSGPRGAVESGDLAGGWVLARLPRLSPRLRNAIFRGLDLAPPRATAHSGETARTAGLPDFGDANFHPSGALTAAADHSATVEGDASHLNHTLALMIVAGTENITSAGDAYPVNASNRLSFNGPYCRVRVSPKEANGSPDQLNGTLAHEVFHCFEIRPRHGLAERARLDPRGLGGLGLGQCLSSGSGGHDVAGLR